MWTAVRPTSLATSLKVGMGAKPLRSFLAGAGSFGRGTRTLPGCWLGACGRDGAVKARMRMRTERIEKERHERVWKLPVSLRVAGDPASIRTRRRVGNGNGVSKGRCRSSIRVQKRRASGGVHRIEAN